MKLFISLSILIFLTPVAAHPTESTTATAEKTLINADSFALGQIGFIGHISKFESAYKEILASSNAEKTLWLVYLNPNSTAATKLYCACGLKKISSSKFSEVRLQLSHSSNEVTTIKGEMLRREPTKDVIARINKFGCD